MVDNHEGAASTKVSLRQWAMDQIGTEAAHVLDCYAGSGAMYRAVWQAAASYRGCDKRFFRDRRAAYVADNLRLLRAIDLAPYTVFDMDAYGSPWHAVTLLAARRQMAKLERIALITTDGAMMRARLGRVEKHAAELSGMEGEGTHAQWGRLTRRAISEAAKRMGGALVDMRAAQRKTQYYAAAIIEASPATDGRQEGRHPCREDQQT